MNSAIQSAEAKQQSARCSVTRSHVCTLFEGDYHLGLAALTNSLVANGFHGTVWAGYRGALPPWATGHKHVVNGDVLLEFVSLDPGIHFANYKPQFMLYLIQSGRIDSGYLWYFDPDIVVHTRWDFFLRWSQFGVCLVEDVNNIFPEDHPIRYLWKEQASILGLKNPKPISKYFNSGFIGIPCSSERTLEVWDSIIATASKDGSDLNSFMPGDRANAFYAIDQDALNAALMYDGSQHTTIGPEAMGFVPGYSVMAHAVGRPKPWEGCRTLRALKGFRPSKAEKLFYTYCKGPVPVFSSWTRAFREFDVRLASAIGRFYGRT